MKSRFFVSGQNKITSLSNRKEIALAICYELSVPQHSKDAYENGAKFYIASVAKTSSGMEKAIESLSNMARQYAMTVLLSNCVGHCDNFDCGGKSSVWNNKGKLIGQLDDTREGLLIFDTDTDIVFAKIIQ